MKTLSGTPTNELVKISQTVLKQLNGISYSEAIFVINLVQQNLGLKPVSRVGGHPYTQSDQLHGQKASQQ